MTVKDLYSVLHQYSPFGFHLSGKAWQQLSVTSLFEGSHITSGEISTRVLRNLAFQYNRMLAPDSALSDWIHAGQLVSVGVIVDILRYVVISYCNEQNKGIIPTGLSWVGKQEGPATAENPQTSFVSLFPPLPVINGTDKKIEYLGGRSELWSNREAAASEIILLSLSMSNPAFKPFRELFDDADLKTQSPYVSLVGSLNEFFQSQPAFEPVGLTLFECLRAPIDASPDSLEGQLQYIREHWSSFLPSNLVEQLLLASDILSEETRLRGLGPGPSESLRFASSTYRDEFSYDEPAAFSRDADWMSNVVLIAKSVYVWLDQLSKKYKRHICILSDIPNEELDQLARWGFTGLWLIGLWERSPASQRIKQIMGNPDAAASAYSLYDYVIAEDLGGEDAFMNLRDRAWQRGIRLASDMVPNHMGIYSKWTVEHPDWFIQSQQSPFPWYQFNGEDLSRDPSTVMQIEDGYWEHRDAAVVFRRIDKSSGETRYIYHGNDGTSMPWNDTAQLNFTLPQVREAVIQLILHVARKCPIIRFDAAMTLAKKHYQRLWFPMHGDGGAIPSRAEQGMSRAEFDAVFPKEFWREVVDRVTVEVPETLLLAEAFWLMEGYFVRTLGMHRVYNSAFMNMLKMEDNAKYRTTIKNVLEFSPEVLKRFVNFMNNPDEATAVAQFGKGDKYFGVAVLMVTMPGLPMFGHGQIEGLTEKYGMEYRRAYWDESTDEEMIHRHEAQVFPLMRRRHLFSGAENFALYDFQSSAGTVDENVFAYSNRSGNERAIIIYNNAYNATSGTIQTSTPVNVDPGEGTHLVRKSLSDALELNNSDGNFYTYRDYQSGLQYVRSGRQLAEEGLYAELGGYQYHAFLDFREIHDTNGTWHELAHRLGGTGVADIEKEYKELELEALTQPFKSVLNPDLLEAITSSDPNTKEPFREAYSGFLSVAKDHAGYGGEIIGIVDDTMNEFEAAGILWQASKAANTKSDDSLIRILIAWISVRRLGQLFTAESDTASAKATRKCISDWMLDKTITQAFEDCGAEKVAAFNDTQLINVLILHENLLASSEPSRIKTGVRGMMDDRVASKFLQINRHNGILWINQEQLERLIQVSFLASTIKSRATGKATSPAQNPAGAAAHLLLDAASKAGYMVEKILKRLTAGVKTS